jgi:predicted permease
MEPVPELVIAEPQDVVIEEVAQDVNPQITDSVTESHTTVVNGNSTRDYPSLYDTYGTTMIAIVFAVGIISAVIGLVQYIYRKAASDHSALTQFVTTMFALIAGVFVADKVVAGPTTELLNGQESLKVLEFIQQTCLMVFAYYFGTKAQPPADGPLNKEE